MKLYYTLTGYRRLKFAKEDAPCVLNLCMKYGYPYREIKNGDGYVSFVCTLHTADRLLHRAKMSGVAIEAEERRGMPSEFLRILAHPGIIVGILPLMFFVWLTCAVVWDIRIDGNERLSKADIEAALETCGFRRGTPLADFDADYTESMTLLSCDELAWISINMKGSVAYVEVREKLEIEENNAPAKPANIIASVSGTVTEIIAYDGLPVVKAGDNVKKGDLLISGVYGEKAPGLLVTRAAGYVKARTMRRVEVEIPYEYEKKEYTGRDFCEKYVIFFGNSIKLFINSRNFGSSCDKIKEETKLSLFGAELPVSLINDRFSEYRTVTSKHSTEEARQLALSELEEILKTELGDAKILMRSDSLEIGENSLKVCCEIVCLENIAEVSDFEIVYN